MGAFFICTHPTFLKPYLTEKKKARRIAGPQICSLERLLLKLSAYALSYSYYADLLVLQVNLLRYEKVPGHLRHSLQKKTLPNSNVSRQRLIDARS